ncbi:MAG: hypothetical protein IKY43_03805 [Bacteroidales bacterium]|nr:hypothetical protein [Bacteroidales bacterium]
MRKLILAFCILTLSFSAQCQVGKYSINIKESSMPFPLSSQEISDSSLSEDAIFAVALLALAEIDMNDLIPQTLVITDEAFVFFNEKDEEIGKDPVKLLSAQKDKWVYKGAEEYGEIVVQKNNDSEYTVTTGDKVKLKLKPIK